MVIVLGEPLRREGAGLNARGVTKYSDFGPIEGYISETVQNRRYVTLVLITNRKWYYELSIGTKISDRQ